MIDYVKHFDSNKTIISSLLIKTVKKAHQNMGKS